MSLFICSKCRVIENHSCNGSKKKLYNNGYPNMGLMDMQGYGDDVYISDADGKSILFKEKSEIMMLCSQCNTGEWHNEFDRKIPSMDSDDEYLARYSKFNYITVSDHDDRVIKRNDDGTFSLANPRLRDFADWMLSGYNKHYNLNESNIIKIATADIRVKYILELFLENMNHFECTVIERLFEEAIPGDAIYQLVLFAKDCIPDSHIPKSVVISRLERYMVIAKRNNIQYTSTMDEFIQLERFIMLSTQIENNHGKLSFEDNILNAIASLSDATGIKTDQQELKELLENIKKMSVYNGFSRLRKPHWKETQSEDERNEKLRKAEEKRLRKLNKK